MILICGNSFDPVIMFLRARWDLDHLAYCVLDLKAEGNSVGRSDLGESSLGDLLADLNRQVEMSELTGVFFRDGGCWFGQGANWPFGQCDPEIAALLNNLPCRVANRPAAGMANRSKPFQALQIRECGFQIPETLVTNDPSVARQFYEERNGKVVFKSISGVRSIVRKLSPEYLQRLSLLRNGPTQFQAFIAGDDIRVHVIGAHCFATRIQCVSIDYRYAWQERVPLKMKPMVLSREVSSRCVSLSRKLGLPLVGIDLKESPTGGYYCFEVNAAPMFSFYERATGQPISAALAEFLGQP